MADRSTTIPEGDTDTPAVPPNRPRPPAKPHGGLRRAAPPRAETAVPPRAAPADGGEEGEALPPASTGLTIKSVVIPEALRRGAKLAPRPAEVSETVVDDRPRRLEPLPLALPAPAGQRKRGFPWLLLSFAAIVVLPTLIACYYYFAIATDQFVSEFRFAIHKQNAQEMPAAAGAILGMPAAVSTVTESYVVVDFLKSPQAVAEIGRRIDLKKLFARNDADAFARLDEKATREELIKYWQRMVDASFDLMTGISTAKVRAFDADDAQTIAKALLAIAEDLVNEMSERARRDSLRLAEREVRTAEERLNSIRLEISKFRNKEQLIDPSAPVSANVELAKTMKANISQMQSDLGALLKSLNANAPQVRLLRNRIEGAEAQLKEIEAKITIAQSGDKALSRVVGGFEELDLKRQTAERIFASTIDSLERARVNASSKMVYLTPYVEPTLSQTSTWPDRPRALGLIFASLLGAWFLATLLTYAVKDHAV